VISANIHRRHMTAGQRAMAVAMVYRDGAKRGRKKAGEANSLQDKELGVHPTRLSYARTVLANAPNVVPEVLSGITSLNDAYGIAVEAKRRAEAATGRPFQAGRAPAGRVPQPERGCR
jgi:hypothetical protein